MAVVAVAEGWVPVAEAAWVPGRVVPAAEATATAVAAGRRCRSRRRAAEPTTFKRMASCVSTAFLGAMHLTRTPALNAPDG